MKFIFLILIFQFVCLALTCYELEDIHKDFNDEDSLEAINKGSMQVNEDYSDLMNEQTKRSNFFEKRLDEEIKKKKKFRPIVYDGYSLDINIDMFKSTVMNNFNYFLLKQNIK